MYPTPALPDEQSPADLREQQDDSVFVNVSRHERGTSLLFGGILAAGGLAAVAFTRRNAAGLLLASLGGGLVYRGLSGHCHAYRALGIDTASDDAPAPADYEKSAGHFVEVVTINKPADDLYDAWRDLSRQSSFMPHVLNVDVLDDKHSRWTLAFSGNVHVHYDAEIINDEPGRVLAWRSTGHADLHNAGSVRFSPAPQGRGTVVKLTVDFIPPVGGKTVARLAHTLGLDGEGYVREGLRNFKRLMEAGELPTTQGQPAGAGRA